MFITVYDTQSGAVKRCVTVFNDADAPLQAQDGESWVEGKSNPNYHLVSGGQIIEKPTIEIEAYELEQAWEKLRRDRKVLLMGCDWTQVPDAPVDQAAWATYRQALRDLPQNTTDPRQVVWPDPPN